MAKGILFFLVVWLLIMSGISIWNIMSGNEKFTALKALTYSFVTAVVAFGIVVLFVVAF